MADTLKTRPFVIARRVRLVCGVLAVMSIAGFLASAHTAFLLMHRSWAIGITGGCFEIGQDPYVRRWGSITPTPDNGVNFVTQQSWDGGYSAAWRPFRAGSSKAS
ncbi:MAG: hypothetical protein ACOYN0_14545, partial [Phycisphaerales bacterium]